MKPINKKVLVEVIKEQEKVGTIIMGDSNPTIGKGKVIAIADDCEFVKEGDVVYFHSRSGTRFGTDDTKQIFIEKDLIGKED